MITYNITFSETKKDQNNDYCKGGLEIYKKNTKTGEENKIKIYTFINDLAEDRGTKLYTSELFLNNIVEFLEFSEEKNINIVLTSED